MFSEGFYGNTFDSLRGWLLTLRSSNGEFFVKKNIQGGFVLWSGLAFDGSNLPIRTHWMSTFHFPSLLPCGVWVARLSKYTRGSICIHIQLALFRFSPRT